MNIKIKSIKRQSREVRITGSMPDVDNDIQGERREEVKRYIEERYGKNRVASIGTYGAMKIKSALSDLMTRAGVPTSKKVFITGCVQNDKLDYTGFFEYSLVDPPLKKFIQEYPDLVEKLPLILNQPKTQSVHAAGVIIVPESENGIFDQLPVKKIDGIIISEWVDDYVEQAGFLKMDILGLKQLDKFSEILQLIKEQTGKEIELTDIPLDDERVYEYFAEGFNEDVFQFQGGGLKGYTKDLKPNKLDDLIATVALYRPGPIDMGSHKDYVRRKNNPKLVEYTYGTEEALKDTYGLMCIAKGSLVTTESGPLSIENVNVGERVLTEDGSFQTVLANIYKGRKETVRVRTTFGEELVCTPDHKVLTQLGWVEAGSLTKKHLIKAFWQTEQRNRDEDSIKDWLIGLFLADGHSPKSGASPQIACSSYDFAKFVLTAIVNTFPSMHGCSIHSQDNGLGVTWFVNIRQKSSPNGQYHSNYEENEFNKMLREHGLYKCVKEEKQWPALYSYNTVVGFLEGDGCFQNGRVRLKYRHLAYGLYQALQSYRIYSSFYQDSDGYWCVKFTPGLIVPKIRAVEKSFNQIYIPREYIAKLKPTNEFDYRNHFLPSLFKKKPYITLEVAMRLGYSKDESKEHLVWGRVLSVKKDTIQDVYDLSIENIHSFVVGNHVVHNCYQEQIMEIVRSLANFTMNEADDIRKAIGKKLPELMKKYKERFVQGAIKNGCPENVASKLWDDIEGFGGYSFNKSHATCYAITGYYCQWLKVHYPVQFWLVALKYATEDKMADRLSEMMATGGLQLGGVDINKSTDQFTTDGKRIYWSLKAVKGLGQVALTDLLDERGKNGDYFSIEELAKRVKGTAVKKNVIVGLILAGAFDSLYNITDKTTVKRFSILLNYFNFIGSKMDEQLEQMKKWRPFQWIIKQRQLCGLGSIDAPALGKTLSFVQHELSVKKLGTLNERGKEDVEIKPVTTEPNMSQTSKYNFVSVTDVIEGDIKTEKDKWNKPTLGGLLTKVIERETKKKEKFGVLQLTDGINLQEVLVWPDYYKHWKDQLEANVNNIIYLHDCYVTYDEKYKKANAVYTGQIGTTKLLIIK